MKHYGDITVLNGAELPVVDCITGGSPCQDLSIAGRREGLAGERSGLFMEQVRIVKEMREEDKKRGRTGAMVRPRFLVWENVPGAFSSNKGRDFQAVLTEIVRIAEPEAPDVPLPDKGKWPKAGCLYDDLGGWSVAWRVHDAQFWGVPQRRKRIALVADFGGLAAPEVLFVRKGLSGDFDESQPAGKEAAAGAGGGSPGAVTLRIRGGCEGGGKGALIQTERSGALGTNQDQTLFVLNDQGGSVMGVSKDVAGALRAQEHGHQPLVYEQHSQDARYNPLGDVCETVSAKYGTGGNNQPIVLSCLPFDTTQITSPQNGNHPHYGDPCHPLAAGMHVPAVVCVGNGQLHQISMAEQANTLDTMHDQQMVLIGLSSNYDTAVDKFPTLRAHESGGCEECVMVSAIDCRNHKEIGDISGCLQAKNAWYSLNYQNPVRVRQTVRRLTPLECERLQGYPDGWTDIGEWVDSKGKKHREADSPRYKALGNSIALPFWFWLLRRISAQYERPATLGSLFDGIGGFPLCWERCNGKGTALWASEIEEFPIAVTKKHFPE